MKTSNRFIAGLCALFIGMGALAAVIVHLNYPNLLLAHDTGADSDTDGMGDLYEAFFGLDAFDPADAAADFDDDTLANLAEAMLLTDPFAPDTDSDGLDDDGDDDPISRAAIRWGDPRFTTGDSYGYTGPAWWLGAGKSGGTWTSGTWTLPAFDAGQLLVDLDPALSPGDLMLGAGVSPIF